MACSDCAGAYKRLAEYGFHCKSSLVSILGEHVTLADVCCKTCMPLGTKKPTKKPTKPTKKPPAKACGEPDYKGDGNCDDDNNNKGCAYDGGDCCYKTVKGGKVKKDYCKQVGWKSQSNHVLCDLGIVYFLKKILIRPYD